MNRVTSIAMFYSFQDNEPTITVCRGTGPFSKERFYKFNPKRFERLVFFVLHLSNAYPDKFKLRPFMFRNIGWRLAKKEQSVYEVVFT